jgi:hypothetical protein
MGCAFSVKVIRVTGSSLEGDLSFLVSGKFWVAIRAELDHV